MQKAVTLVVHSYDLGDLGEPVQAIFPQAVPKRSFYTDFRRFARTSGISVLIIHVFLRIFVLIFPRQKVHLYSRTSAKL